MTGQAVERHAGVEEMSDRQWAALERKAAVLAKSNLVPEHFRGKPNDILLVGLTAHDLGVQLTLTNLGQFYVIKNRVGLMAQLQIGLASRAGHEFRWGKCDDRSATVEIRRAGSSTWQPFTFTIERAERAGLLKNDVWGAYPEDMLQCRAVTRAIRRVCPDVLLGIPSFDDGGGDLDDSVEGEVVDDAPELVAGDQAPGTAAATDEADEASAHRQRCTEVHRLINAIPKDNRPDFAAAWRQAGLPRTAQQLEPGQVAAAEGVVRRFIPAPLPDEPEFDVDEPQYGPGEEPFE